MSEQELQQPVPRLWTAEGFREDGWLYADTAEALGGNRQVILPLEAYLALGDNERAANRGRLGVRLLPGEPLETIAPYLAELALVSLAFPAFNDGRSYSKAELLRSRHGYQGIVRASGDVLIDQIPLMLRTGFTEFEVSNPTALRRLEEGRLGGLPFYYQPTAQASRETARYSWRRLPA